MTHPTPDPLPPDHPVDRLVRDHLDHEAARTDAAGMVRRVTAARSVTPSRARRIAKSIGVGAAIAAGVALVFLYATPEPPQAVAAETAAEVIEKARAIHAEPTDRCYEVVAEWDPIPLKRLKLDPIVRKSRLWTRGDQFWIDSETPDGRHIAWGQTADGRVWIVPPMRRHGLVYDPDEVGEPVIRHCELMSLRVVATLGELLEHFQLMRRDSGQPGEPVRISAMRRPTANSPAARFNHLDLELDPDTKVIRSAVLRRVVSGEVVGTLRFTLVETATLPENQYDVRGHLDPGAIILDGRAKLPPKLPGLVPFDPRAKFRDDVLKRFQDRAK